MMILLSLLILLASADDTSGGWTEPHNPTSSEIIVWRKTLNENNNYLMDDGEGLQTLGTPIQVSTQVVAGTNYKFEFDDAEVIVFVQPWNDLYEITSITYAEVDNSDTTNDNSALLGGVGNPTALTQQELDIWNNAVRTTELTGEYGQDYLLGLGDPVSVQTQVVSGTMYYFTFSNRAVVTVYSQPWTNTVEIVEVDTSAVQDTDNSNTDAVAGGVGGMTTPTDDEVDLWYEAAETAIVQGTYGENYLLGLGRPIGVQTQVVSGTNYFFTFSDGTVVTVYSEPWSYTLKITDIDTNARGRRLQGGKFMAGGITKSTTCANCDKWQEVLNCGSPCMSLEGYEAFDYAALGDPISSATQVVAGVNYFFEFADNTRITVLEQAWMTPSLQITNIDSADTDNRPNYNRPSKSTSNDIVCPENQVWLDCQSACPLVCGQPEVQCMSFVCITGCGCESGFWLDGQKCVKQELCSDRSNNLRNKYRGVKAALINKPKKQTTGTQLKADQRMKI